MSKQVAHWTQKSVEDFQHSIAADFIAFIESSMDEEGVSQAELAKRLGVNPSRVSQVLNNPGNLTLKKVVEYVRVLGRKVAVVGYDDGDRENMHGPVNAEVFHTCWKHMDSPTNFFVFNEICEKRKKPACPVFIVVHGVTKTASTDHRSQGSWSWNTWISKSSKDLHCASTL